MEDNEKSYSIVVKEAKEVKTMEEAKHLLTVTIQLVEECKTMLQEYIKARDILVERIEGDLALEEALAKDQMLQEL